MDWELVTKLIKQAYESGLSKGEIKGYELGLGYQDDMDMEEDEEDEELPEEAEEPGCTCPQCVSPAEYDSGYAAGYGNTGPVPDDESYPYRTGYLDGQADSKKGTDGPV
jgi:hypothetical protein